MQICSNEYVVLCWESQIKYYAGNAMGKCNNNLIIPSWGCSLVWLAACSRRGRGCLRVWLIQCWYDRDIERCDAGRAKP